ncbi:bifunctional 2-polyprenyl-6-hydroxyphenol methylase/3-demethylubiquinol 3-O-methyltransferase UbiG [Streptomyces pactum]|uniref:SAM-dependent methyltransferase n=1 Tax=Streptomyces pactum TaxID=68249 RepID=A0A1S6J336_9ACTN|nr:class I SAM-dependent methyltransferase [Streptomyces pactum]AQS66165.1 SAM-dependent methyltransferase [Streptomyces pactum]
MSPATPPYPARGAASYWEPVWQRGRRFRAIDRTETEALGRHLGTGRGRPALDIGCGEGALTAHLAALGYRSVGVDCSPTAVALARTRHPAADIRVFDFDADDAAGLPHPAFAVITCRLVYRWAADKPGFLSRVRALLAPGGVFWVVTSVHDPARGAPRSWDCDAPDVELLTTGWSRVDVHELDPSFHCYGLRP